MKSVIKIFSFILLITVLALPSCKKETSCEGCATKSNKPPIAVAGSDLVITLPIDSVLLDGRSSSDPDGSINNYLWTKISGPVSFNIIKPTDSITKVNALVVGNYLFELKVTDTGGLFSRDTIQVAVNPGTPLPSTCNSGNRPLINTLLTPVTIIPSGGYCATIGNKMLFMVRECSDCEDPTPIRSYYNIYDVVTQTWSVSRDHLMNPRGAGTTIITGSKIFYGGGYNTDGTTYSAVYSDVDIYDISTDTWTMSSLSVGRSDLTGAVVNNKVFFAGGLRRDPNIPPNAFSYILSDIVDIYDLSSNTWSTAALSEARRNLSAVTIADKIYFAGGFIGNSIPDISNRIDVYNNISNSWTTSSLTEPKAAMASIAVGNKIFWAGGVRSYQHDNTGYSYILTNSVEIKDISSQSSVMTCLFQPNLGLNAVLDNNRIVYSGGGGYTAEKNKFDIYDLTTGNWSVGVLPVTTEYYSFIITVNGIKYIMKSNQLLKVEF